MKAYLATGSDEDEEEAEVPDADRYRKLLLAGADAQQPLHRKGGKDWGAATNGTADEEDQACCVSFNYQCHGCFLCLGLPCVVGSVRLLLIPRPRLLGGQAMKCEELQQLLSTLQNFTWPHVVLCLLATVDSS